MVVNIPLAVLIPSSSGHGALAMPLLAPLADFAGVSRATTITAWIMGHGLALLVAPTSVVLVGGLAIAKVGYDQYLRFVWPLLAGAVGRIDRNNRPGRELRVMASMLRCTAIAVRSCCLKNSQGACPCP